MLDLLTSSFHFLKEQKHTHNSSFRITTNGILIRLNFMAMCYCFNQMVQLDPSVVYLVNGRDRHTLTTSMSPALAASSS